jgi:hypothetical protein
VIAEKQEQKNAKDYAIDLLSAVKGKRVDFTQSFFKRYAREFKTAIEIDAIPHATLEKAIPYIAEHWEAQQLTVQKAVAGVQSRQPRSATENAADRIRGYEHLFELSPRQKAMDSLIQAKGHEWVLEAVRERPEELQEYLEGKMKEAG